MRLMGVIGCTLWMSSCKQAPEAQTSANYAIMGHRTKRFFQWSGKMGERF